MPPHVGWYLFGPVFVLVLLGVTAAVLRWNLERRADPLRELYRDNLVLFSEVEDFGLLSPVALAEDTDVAREVRRILTAAGIRSTTATSFHGHLTVLVFAEEVDLARRLVGGSPGRPYPDEA